MSFDEVFAAAGCTGFVHATTLDGRHEVGLRPDDAVVPASVIKVLVAVEAEAQMADGRLDPARRVLLRADRRTTGPTGISLFRDDVVVSARDLPVLVLTISDNVCTDALLDLVGLDAVNATAARGLRDTVLASNLAELIDSLARDTGFADWAAFEAWSDAESDATALAAADERLRAATALRPGSPTRTTARDMTRLLRLIWSDEAGPADACARVRWLMKRQITKERIASGFPPGVGVAAKSGALMGVVRNEVGMVTRPGEPPCAVAVFTRTERPGTDPRLVDAAIGRVAARAVAELTG
ncbi:MAG: serine hydrolase [Nocardioides sp.]